MSKTNLTIAAMLPLPEDLMEASKLQTEALQIAEKFRAEWTAFATKKKIEGASVTGRVVRVKGPSAPKSPAPAGPTVPLPPGQTAAPQSNGGEATVMPPALPAWAAPAGSVVGTDLNDA